MYTQDVIFRIAYDSTTGRLVAFARAYTFDAGGRLVSVGPEVRI